jgi:hypothetical protein
LRIATLLAQAVLSIIPLPLAVKPLLEILLFPIGVSLISSVIISLVPLWTFANFAHTATSGIFLWEQQSFWSTPNPSLDCRFVFEEFVDDLVMGGGYPGFFVQHELQKDCPVVVSGDAAKVVEDVLLLTHLGDCLWVHIGVGCISISGHWPWAESMIIDFPIDSRRVDIDISAVL